MAIYVPRLSAPTLQVLALLLTEPGEKSGAEIARETGIASGTLYPILMRFEQARWLESRWEEEDPHKLGRPRRRFYRLTDLGAEKSTEAIRRITFSKPADRLAVIEIEPELES